MAQSPEGATAHRPEAITDAAGVVWQIRLFDSAVIRNGQLTNGIASVILAHAGLAWFLDIPTATRHPERTIPHWWTSESLNIWADHGPDDPTVIPPPPPPPPPPPGQMPVSADFVALKSDPFIAQGPGQSAGYSSMHADEDGVLWTFGISHTWNEFNGARGYDPRIDDWVLGVAHGAPSLNPVPRLPDGTEDFASPDYRCLNRDNHISAVLKNGYRELWVGEGERGIDISNRWRGIIDLAGHKWKYVEDDPAGWRVATACPTKIWDGIGHHLAGPDVVAFYGGIRSAPGAYLERFRRNPSGSPPWILDHFYHDDNGNPTVIGAKKAFYTSQSFGEDASGTKILWYGGSTDGASNIDLRQLDPVAQQPIEILLSTNPLPAPIAGQGVMADRCPARNLFVITDCTKVQVVDLATQAWAEIPVNSVPGTNFPSLGSGTGFQGRWAPTVKNGDPNGMFIIYGLNGATCGLRLNFA